MSTPKKGAEREDRGVANERRGRYAELSGRAAESVRVRVRRTSERELLGVVDRVKESDEE